jgi:predicted alpha/beta hydrolase
VSAPLEVDTIGGRQPLDVFPAASGSEGGRATVAVLPALGIAGSYYAGFARALAARGLNVVVSDLPGHGASPARPRRGVGWSYRELVQEHLPAVHAAARARWPDAPFYWVGHSLGGQLALLHAGAGSEVDGVALVASGTAFYRAWPLPRAAWLLFATQACGLLARGLGTFPGHRLGFGGHEAGRLIADWARLGRTGRYAFRDLDGEALLARWRGPTLAVPLGGDVFAPRPAMAHPLSKTRATVTWAPWDDPAGPLDHNRWPRTPEPAAERVATWIAGLV